MIEKLPIHCSSTHRLLANMDKQALYLWCRTCRREHAITKDALFRAFEEMHAPECGILAEKQEITL